MQYLTLHERDQHLAEELARVTRMQELLRLELAQLRILENRDALL